jgi:hypothetical protein
MLIIFLVITACANNTTELKIDRNNNSSDFIANKFWLVAYLVRKENMKGYRINSKKPKN